MSIAKDRYAGACRCTNEIAVKIRAQLSNAVASKDEIWVRCDDCGQITLCKRDTS